MTDDRRKFARAYMLWATVVCAILGIVFGYLDLSISVAVADSSRGWALAFQRWGELPGSVVVACAAFLLIGRDRSNEPANVRWGAPMLLIVLTTFLLNYMVHVLFERPRDGAEALAGSGPAWIGGCLLLCLIVPALVRQTRWSRDPRVQRFASLGVAHGAAVMLLILGLKELWGRVRFRDLSAGYWEFSQWFAPNGPNGNSSFPSGHTGFAWLVLPLIALVPARFRTAAVVAIAVWGTAAAVSRVAVGAHYASDVTFATYFATTIFVMLWSGEPVDRVVTSATDEQLA